MVEKKVKVVKLSDYIRRIPADTSRPDKFGKALELIEKENDVIRVIYRKTDNEYYFIVK